MFSHLILWWLIMKRANVCSRELDDRMPVLCFSNIQFPHLRHRVDNNQKEMSAMSLRSFFRDLRLFFNYSVSVIYREVSIIIFTWKQGEFERFLLVLKSRNFKNFIIKKLWSFFPKRTLNALYCENQTGSHASSRPKSLLPQSVWGSEDINLDGWHLTCSCFVTLWFGPFRSPAVLTSTPL